MKNHKWTRSARHKDVPKQIGQIAGNVPLHFTGLRWTVIVVLRFLINLLYYFV